MAKYMNHLLTSEKNVKNSSVICSVPNGSMVQKRSENKEREANKLLIQKAGQTIHHS